MDCQGDFVSRSIMGIMGVTIWLVGAQELPEGASDFWEPLFLTLNEKPIPVPQPPHPKRCFGELARTDAPGTAALKAWG